MNIHLDTTTGKARSITATTHANSHGTQVPVGHRAPPAGRGSSKKTQNQKGKKHHPDSHDASKMELSGNGPTMDMRLATTMQTGRLDLSLSRHILALPGHIQRFQIFPVAIIEHVTSGHHLTEIWLTNHRLGSLPAEIAVFKKLRVLGLTGNALAALPEELGQLTALERLYLDKNRLQALPSKVAFPPQLRELRLDNNQLSVFPTQITKLRLLNRLGLSHNWIKELPEQIQRLRNLVEFDLDYNRLDTGLPNGFAALQRLERLGLEGNFLAERPEILDRLPVLSYIRLSGSRAKQFLPTTDHTNIGSTRQLLAVPQQHDGYFQCVESNNKTPDSEGPGPVYKKTLEGLIPCRDQTVLNMLSYCN